MKPIFGLAWLLTCFLVPIAYAADEWKEYAQAACVVYGETGSRCSGTVIEEDKERYYLLTAGHCVSRKIMDWPSGSMKHVPTKNNWIRFTFTGEQSGFIKTRLEEFALNDNQDYAILSFAKSNLNYPKPTVIPLATNFTIKENMIVWHMGSPQGVFTSLSKGNIESVFGDRFWLETHAIPGQSGSAVIHDGQVIGLIILSNGGCYDYTTLHQ